VKELTCVILAAGRSRRMGQPKLLLRLGGESLLRRAAKTALGVCPQVVVVVGAEADRMREELTGLPVTVVENPDYAQGISTSLRRGIQAASGADAVLVLLADQVAVTPDHLRTLVDVWQRTSARVVASTYGGTVGPPVIFHRSIFPDLVRLMGDVGAKPVIERYRAEAVWVPLPEATLDVDTPEDWIQAQRLLSGRAPAPGGL